MCVVSISKILVYRVCFEFFLYFSEYSFCILHLSSFLSFVSTVQINGSRNNFGSCLYVSKALTSTQFFLRIFANINILFYANDCYCQIVCCIKFTPYIHTARSSNLCVFSFLLLHVRTIVTFFGNLYYYYSTFLFLFLFFGASFQRTFFCVKSKTLTFIKRLFSRLCSAPFLFHSAVFRLVPLLQLLSVIFIFLKHCLLFRVKTIMLPLT